jgi:hypothetical protein
VEGKNGAIVRKHIGYGFIGAEHAAELQRFFTAQFNPYLNFHRPCGYAALAKGPRGQIKRRYPADDYRTPFEKLCSLDNWQQYLKPGTTEAFLRVRASALSGAGQGTAQAVAGRGCGRAGFDITCRAGTCAWFAQGSIFCAGEFGAGPARPSFSFSLLATADTSGQ